MTVPRYTFTSLVPLNAQRCHQQNVMVSFNEDMDMEEDRDIHSSPECITMRPGLQ